jgi:hypothetical protein
MYIYIYIYLNGMPPFLRSFGRAGGSQGGPRGIRIERRGHGEGGAKARRQTMFVHTYAGNSLWQQADEPFFKG